jgi:hypothetical protein
MAGMCAIIPSSVPNRPDMGKNKLTGNRERTEWNVTYMDISDCALLS